MTTRGVLYVHSAPRALCPHVEWAIAGVLGTRVNLDWIRQPAAPGTWRSEFSWKGEVGTASKLASALRGWHLLRFEVTAEPCATAEGERYSCTPELGIFHAVTGIHGDILIPEDRLRAALTRSQRDRRRSLPEWRPCWRSFVFLSRGLAVLPVPDRMIRHGVPRGG